MIIIRLKGGLGNQMFQYAFGRYLSIKNKDNLKLDLSFLKRPAIGYTKRKYELGIFNIHEEFAKENEIPFIIRNNNLVSKFLIKFFKNNFYLVGVNYHPEENLKKILKLKGDLYLDGSWQDYHFPDAIKSTLIKEFSLKEEGFPDDRNKKVIYEMKNSTSVSVHIRRMDYVSLSENEKMFSYCNENYYNKAIDFIEKKIKKPRFFFFSDDINWVKNNFRVKESVYINWNKGKNAYYDMILMSNCQNHIIANSSFSWWGAWLDQQSDKIIIAPKIWNKQDKESSKRILLNNWIKM